MADTRTKKTVAFLTSSLTIRLSRDIWSGIQEACHNADINSLCFTGELFYPEDSESTQSGANIVYDLVDPSTIDGVIVYTADIGELVGESRMKQLCDSFKGIPTVSIAWPIEEIPTISIDNYVGMYQLIEHLVKDHGYREIAFVQGPMDNPEAKDRFHAFSDVLTKYEIPLRDEYICAGEFSRISGHDAVEKLLKENNYPLDAIVCVDDETAVGVNEAIRSLGLKIPEDIAITGFDNEAMSGVMTPPLTTVEQPLYREGHLALRTLIRIWNGEEVEPLFKTPTELILRRSCGCQERVFNGLLNKDMLIENSGTEDTLRSVEELMIRHMRDISIDQKLAISFEDSEKLVHALIEAHSTTKDDEFNTILWEILTRLGSRREFLFPIQEIFSRFHQIGLTVLNSTALIRFEAILHRARITISNVAEQLNSFLRIDAVEKLIDLGDVNYVLNAHFTRKDIRNHFEEIADRNFNRLGIKHFFLVFYNDPKHPLEDSRLIMAWDEGESREDGDEEIVFPTKKLLPSKYSDHLRSKHLMISPLFFNEDQYGYIIVESIPDDSMTSDILSWQISGALNRIDLIRKESERRAELENSLDELKKTQSRLVEAEKMASLGNLVAGVAHEINTPVGASVTYASYFESITDKIVDDFLKGNMSKKELAAYFKKGKEVSQGLLLNLNRAAELIRSFKEVAIDQSTAVKREFNLHEYLDEILLSMKSTIARSRHIVDVSCPDDLVIQSVPGHFSQVITNLIMNSITHAFPEETQGIMTITVEEYEEFIEIFYRDNGMGFSEKVKEQIFEPFFTTKRNMGGSGLGMHIVYNLITQSLCGEISCESSEGNGVEFRIALPKRLE